MKNKIIIMLILFCCVGVYAAEKPIISVLDFYTEEGISKSEMRLFISLLSSALFQTKIYIVIDVSERDTLLNEMEFSMSDCTDESCQLEIGRLLAAEAIVIGRIGRLGSRYVLSIKMLETDTGRAINTADGVYNSIDDMVDDVGRIASSLASAHMEEGTVSKETVIAEDDLTEDTAADTDIEETTTDEKIIKPIPEPGLKKSLPISIGIEGGPGFSIGPLCEYFRVSVLPLLMVNYELNFKIGKLGLGIVSGIDIWGTKSEQPDIRYPYDLFLVPVGANIRFESGFMLPLFFLVEGIGGVILGTLEYIEDTGPAPEGFFLRPFSAATAGFGYSITPSIRCSICGTLMVIFTESDPVMGITPMARIEIRF